MPERSGGRERRGLPIGWANEKGRERASAAPGIVIVLLARVNAAYLNLPFDG